MTAFKAQYLRDAQLNWYRGTAFPTALANVYVALVTTAPTAIDGTGLVEATGGSYARQPLSNANLNAPATTGTGTTAVRQDTSGAQLSYTSMPACTVVGIAAYDAATVGNFLGYADLTGGSQVVASGATFNLPSATGVVLQEL